MADRSPKIARILRGALSELGGPAGFAAAFPTDGLGEVG